MTAGDGLPGEDSRPDEAAHMAADVDLTIRLTEAPGAPTYEFRLVLRSSGLSKSRSLEGSTLPDPAAALAAVERFAEEVFFAPRRADMMCTQQYGGPQVAVVTGTFHGRAVAQPLQPDGWLRDCPLACHGPAFRRHPGDQRPDLARHSRLHEERPGSFAAGTSLFRHLPA